MSMNLNTSILFPNAPVFRKALLCHKKEHHINVLN
uniref:Uncharacterized protein n=1 Tax=Arundo donax TaxID=35708 RepID=A0A0A9ED19_ARUDO